MKEDEETKHDCKKKNEEKNLQTKGVGFESHALPHLRRHAVFVLVQREMVNLK